MPGNYRGVHLTAILSKTAERLIGQRLVLHLQKCAFGNYQWAFTPKLSSRDLVTALVMSWILSICTGKKIAAYLSDITGAFDRVFKTYLMAKLYDAGVGPVYLNFLRSYLQPRRATVVVEGTMSDEIEIINTVLQGTVLGTPLWHTFFNDVSMVPLRLGADPAMFADDLNYIQAI